MIALALAAITILAPANLAPIVEQEVKAAVAESAAAGVPVGCDLTVHIGRFYGRAESRPGTCEIFIDERYPDVQVNGQPAPNARFDYLVRHEVAHVATQNGDHHDRAFRRLEGKLAANVGIGLVYGDEPDGYPIAFLSIPPDGGTVQLPGGATTGAAELRKLADPATDEELAAMLCEAKPVLCP